MTLSNQHLEQKLITAPSLELLEGLYLPKMSYDKFSCLSHEIAETGEISRRTLTDMQQYLSTLPAGYFATERLFIPTLGSYRLGFDANNAIYVPYLQEAQAIAKESQKLISQAANGLKVDAQGLYERHKSMLV